MMKRKCLECCIIKKLSEFYYNKTRRDINPLCKQCHNIIFPKSAIGLSERIKNNKEKRIKRRKKRELEIKKYQRKWAIENRDKKREAFKRYQCAKHNQTPPSSIKEVCVIFYWMAQQMSKIMSEPYHVDHIIPLQPKDRAKAGLHHHTNLQVMRGKENIRKSNHIK